MQKDLTDLHQQLLLSSKKNHFVLENIYHSNPVDTVAFIKKSSTPQAPTIYLSSGIHGDEPAGPLALAKLLEESFFDDTINWYIIPLLNPRGLALGTRENPEGFDLNRDYYTAKTKEVSAHLQWFKQHPDIVLDLSISLHEDWESPGFYAYSLVPSKYTAILPAIANAIVKVSPINLANIIEGMPAQGGFITHTHKDFHQFINSRTDWPEAFFLMKKQPTPFHFTFETASSQPIDQRIQTHCIAIKTALKFFNNVPR